MVKFIKMVGQPHRKFTKMASRSRVPEYLINLIRISYQLKWDNHYTHNKEKDVTHNTNRNSSYGL